MGGWAVPTLQRLQAFVNRSGDYFCARCVTLALTAPSAFTPLPSAFLTALPLAPILLELGDRESRAHRETKQCGGFCGPLLTRASPSPP
jgi:hypothetical protein